MHGQLAAWVALFGLIALGLGRHLLHLIVNGYLYNQETGTSANGAAMNAYIESAPAKLPQKVKIYI
jgi:hypothetical protein